MCVMTFNRAQSHATAWSARSVQALFRGSLSAEQSGSCIACLNPRSVIKQRTRGDGYAPSFKGLLLRRCAPQRRHIYEYGCTSTCMGRLAVHCCDSQAGGNIESRWCLTTHFKSTGGYVALPALATAGITPRMTPAGGGGATVGPGESLACVAPTLSLGAQLTRWKGGWTAQGGAARAPTCQKDSSCGCRERCGGDDGVRNTAHAELTWTAAGTVLPLSAVHHIVYTPMRCLAALREASAGTRR
jgi:hypothetical protein